MLNGQIHTARYTCLKRIFLLMNNFEGILSTSALYGHFFKTTFSITLVLRNKWFW